MNRKTTENRRVIGVNNHTGDHVEGDKYIIVTIDAYLLVGAALALLILIAAVWILYKVTEILTRFGLWLEDNWKALIAAFIVLGLLAAAAYRLGVHLLGKDEDYDWSQFNKPPNTQDYDQQNLV